MARVSLNQQGVLHDSGAACLNDNKSDNLEGEGPGAKDRDVCRNPPEKIFTQSRSISFSFFTCAGLLSLTPLG
jgi:hypothetical protein